MKFVGDTTLCSVGKANFITTLRLFSHLGDGRVRSKTRKVSCHDAFLASGLALIHDSEAERLAIRDRVERQRAVKTGHTHNLAVWPAQR